MRKRIKIILICIALALGLLILIAGGFGLRFYLTTRSMSPAETSRINDTVYCIRDKFVNAYLFRGKNGFLLVDAGFDETSFKTELGKLGITPAQISTLLLTHTDGDHIGAIGLLKTPRIYMQKEEEQMINGKKGKFFLYHYRWKFGPYRLLSDKDTLTIDGLKIKIFHTPGHTPGSSCYQIGNDYLATGDNLAYKNGKFEHFIDFFNMNTAEQEASLKTLPALNSIKYILTGHHGIIKSF